jgi:hypothetical protein
MSVSVNNEVVKMAKFLAASGHVNAIGDDGRAAATVPPVATRTCRLRHRHQ